MPDLEQSIAEWRREMFLAGLRSPDVLNELESHLRDDMARETRSGTESEQAFEAAVLRIGQSKNLKTEFKKIGGLKRAAARAKNTALAFAGIPNHYTSMDDSTPNLDSRLATYLRSTIFISPALFLLTLVMIYVQPQLKALWLVSGVEDKSLEAVSRFDFALMYLFKDNFLYIGGVVIIVLGLLEWRVRQWPRYRRAVFGTGVFLVNLATLFPFFIMIIMATVAATRLLAHLK